MLSPKMICGVHVRGDTVVQWLVALVALFLSFDSSSGNQTSPQLLLANQLRKVQQN